MKKVKNNAGLFTRINFDIILIIFIFIIIAAIINPIRELPLNDDWAYADTVKKLFETGHLQLNQSICASVIFQIYWGALFCLPYGFSFTALRLSTLVISLCGVIAFYLILREFGIDKKKSRLGALCLYFNPIYLELSFTFMSDIHYLALVILSFLFYLKGIHKSNHSFLILGSIFASCAFLVRQIGISIIISVLIYLAYEFFKYRNVSVVKIISSLAVPGIIIVSYFSGFHYLIPQTWEQSHVSYMQTLAQLTDVKKFLIKLFFWTFWSILYLGFFIFPILAGYIEYMKKFKSIFLKHRFNFLFFLLLILPAAFVEYYFWHSKMPYLINIMSRWAGFIPSIIWTIITIMSTFSAIALLCLLSYGIIEYVFKNNDHDKTLLFICVNGILHFMFILSYNMIYDEYLISILPMSLIIILYVLNLKKIRTIVSIAILVLTALYSVISTRAFIDTKAAVWNAGVSLMKKGVPVQQIDAGMEWRGWFFFDKAFEQLLDDSKNGVIHADTIYYLKNYVDSEYKITAFSEPPEGYKVIEKKKYATLFGEKDIQIAKKL